jgi:hypothetical protein
MKRLVPFFIVGAFGIVAGVFAGKGPRKDSSAPIAITNIPVIESRLHGRKRSYVYADLSWAEIESDDLHKYVANLRSIKCPERTIYDIIHELVFTVYQAKVNAVFDPLAKYWSNDEEVKAVDQQVRVIRAERDKLLADIGIQSPSNNESKLASDKQQHVSEALILYPKVTLDMSASPEDAAKLLENRKARIAYLAQFLTPDELLEYRITQDGSSRAIGQILGGINPSDDEFRKIFSVLDGQNLNSTNGYFSSELEEKLKIALGDSRYAQYHEQTVPENAIFNQFVNSLNLSSGQIQQLQDLRSSVGTSLSSKFDPEYQRAVKSILVNPNAAMRYFNNPYLYQKMPQH